VNVTARNARIVLAVTAAVFVVVTATIVVLGSVPGDTAVRDWLLGLATPGVLSALHVLNRAGTWRVLLPGTLVMFVVFPRARRRWWLWALMMIAAPLTEGSLKYLVDRPRPEAMAPGYPSGHATAAAAFFGAVIYLAAALPPRLRAPVRVAAVAIVLLVGLARVMLRAHWPSDVLAGFALGLALASLVTLLDSPERAA
jgi:undecaprenyl-diphosphatase